MKEHSVRTLVQGALVAAAYAVLAWVSSAFGLAFGPVQLRLSEALCLLPGRWRPAVPALAVGCLLANLLSPYGLADLVVGTAATLLAAELTARSRSIWGAALAPVVCNGVIVGALLAWEQAGASAAFAPMFGYFALTVGAGEAAVCFLVGMPLLRALEKRGIV